MPRLEQLFSDADREAVNRAVLQAESKTSSEIVPVVAASSGRYDRPEDIVGLWTGLLALAVTWSVYPTPEAETGDWGTLHPGWQLLALIAAVVVGFVGGAILGSRVDGLRRLFTPRQQMTEEVLASARTVFFDHRVHHTAASSGVLLYVSLFERMAAVIADELVLEKIGQDKVNALCSQFTARLHQAGPTVALCETAYAVGECLGPYLPRDSEDVNELPDALVLIG